MNGKLHDNTGFLLLNKKKRKPTTLVEALREFREIMLLLC
jgi:hypothetical protein